MTGDGKSLATVPGLFESPPYLFCAGSELNWPDSTVEELAGSVWASDWTDRCES